MTFPLSRRQSLRRLAAGASSVLAAPLAARPQGGPKVLRIVVPFPPGGSTDLLARRIGEKLAAASGQTLALDYRVGAGGTLAAEHVARAAPDGATLLMGVTGSNAIAQSLYPRLPYHVIDDFAPVSMVVSSPLVVAVHPAVPAGTLPGFVELARARPGTIGYGSSGNGTAMHLTGEMFKQACGISIVHIPYRGSAGMLSDLTNGQIQASFADLLAVLPQLKAGRLRPLAVTSLQRHPMLPDVPTVAESGYPGFEALSWQGLFAPSGTPAERVEKISAEANEALRSPDIQVYFVSRGFQIEGTTPAAFRRLVAADVEKWSAVVRASGATPG